jgi:hypothetical protein
VSEQPEFFTYTRDEFIDEFVHPVAELATLADYVHALGGELKVIADFGDSWQRVA